MGFSWFINIKYDYIKYKKWLCLFILCFKKFGIKNRYGKR